MTDPEVRVRNINGTIIISSETLAKSFLLVLMTICFADAEILVPEGAMLPPGAMTVIPLKWKLRLPPSYFELSMPLH